MCSGLFLWSVSSISTCLTGIDNGLGFSPCLWRRFHRHNNLRYLLLPCSSLSSYPFYFSFHLCEIPHILLFCAGRTSLYHHLHSDTSFQRADHILNLYYYHFHHLSATLLHWA